MSGKIGKFSILLILIGILRFCDASSNSLDGEFPLIGFECSRNDLFRIQRLERRSLYSSKCGFVKVVEHPKEIHNAKLLKETYAPRIDYVACSIHTKIEITQCGK